MTEIQSGHAGKVFCCIPLRLYVALVGAIFLFWNVGEIFHFLIWYPMHPPAPPRPCTSHNCMQVLTCKGMQDTTRHIREPYLLIGGVIFGAMGLYGAAGIRHDKLEYFAYFLLGLSLVYVLCLLLDSSFLGICEAYPSNVIHQTLLWDVQDIPIMEDKKVTLQEMAHYPYTLVNWQVGTNVWRWSFLISTIYALIALYSSHAAMQLSRLYTDGPIGLGVNYRLGVWRAEVLLKHRIEELMEDELRMNEEAVNEIVGDEPKKKKKVPKVEHLAHEEVFEGPPIMGPRYGTV